jgi:fructokinase
MSRGGAVLVVGEVIADLVVVGNGQWRSPGLTDFAPRLDAAEDAQLAPTENTPPVSAGTLQILAHAGGSPANVAIGLARLDVPVQFAGRLSSFGLGPWLSAHLTANGVDVSPSVLAAEAPTLALVDLDVEGLATYRFYGPETADWQWRPEELPRVQSPGIAAVHTGSLATAIAPGAETLVAWARQLRADRRVLLSYDPNVRPSCVTDRARLTERVHPWIRLADLIKVSKEDLAFLHPGADPVEVCRHWAAEGPELVVLTAGAHPAVAFRPDRSCVVGPIPSGAVVDTVGAGDAFSAGLLASLACAGSLHPGGISALDAEQLYRCLTLATRVASLTCGRAGADPPCRSELSQS